MAMEANGAEPLPILDIELATKRVGGNAKLIEKLLVRFRESGGGFHADFEAAVAAADDVAARRVAHTLKGSAGAIGATALQAAAATLEAACAEADATARASSFATCVQVLAATMAAIERHIGHP